MPVMTTFHDVPANFLIPALASKLGDMDGLSMPEWASVVKTGIHRERPPGQDDWWAQRSAAVLRKVGRDGPIGTNLLAQAFGGKLERNVAPNRAAQGGRKIIRTVLIQLEAAGLLQKVAEKTIKNIDDEEQTIYKGRIITPAGHKLLDEVAQQVRAQAEESYPGLEIY